MTFSSRSLLVIFAAITSSVLATDIILMDGRVLADATIIGQSPRNVTVKSATGLISIRKDLLPLELQSKYPLNEAAARDADQRAIAARAAEKERNARSLAKREATIATQNPSTEKEAAELKSKRQMVASSAQASAKNYFETKYAWVPDTTPTASITIDDAQPIAGWSDRWRVKGRAIIRRLKNHDLELQRLYRNQPSDSAALLKRSKEIRLLENDFTSEYVDFECNFSTDGSEPSFDIKLHT